MYTEPPIKPIKQSTQTFKAIAIAYVSLLLLGLSDNIRGPIYPEVLNSFHLSNTEGSLFFSLSSAFGFLGGLMSAHLVLQFSRLQVLRISILGLLGAQVVMASAIHFSVLLGASVIFGFSLGVMGVVQNMLVVQALDPGPRKNKILSGLHSMYAGASVLAPLVVNAISWLKPSENLWRNCFYVTASLSGVVFATSFLGPEVKDASVPVPPIDFHPSAQRKQQIFFAFTLAFYVVCEILVSSRMALYMRREFAATLTESSWYTAGFFVCLFSGRLLFTFWAPAMALPKQLYWSLGLSFSLLALGILVHPVALMLSGLAMAPFYPLMMSMVGHLFPHSIAKALSWCVGISSALIVIMHICVGFLTDALDIRFGFAVGPLCCLLSGVLLISYEKIFRRQQHSF
jgi:FHS family glucose/mannose:H+ symporter-like MFS transporter